MVHLQSKDEPRKKGCYASFESMIYAYGRLFEPNPTKIDYTAWMNKFEYTAQMATDENVYCEGYILMADGNYCRSAWLYNKEKGIITDLVANGLVYLGLAFNASYVQEVYRKTSRWGIFEDKEILTCGIPRAAIIQ